MRKLYIDASLGVSGDMLLGGFIDLGVKLSDIKKELFKLKLKNYTITTRKETRHYISGLKLSVKCKEEQCHRSYKDIKKTISSSKLDKEVKNLSLQCFHLIAEAEAKVHNTTIEKIHFHEVGALDSIIDIVGVAIAYTTLKNKFGKIEVYASSLNPGMGTVKTQHGLMPVPAPATTLLLKNIPLTKALVSDEVSTPTGVALIKTLATSFGAIPNMTIEKVAVAIGHKKFAEAPNLLRLMLSSDLSMSDLTEEDLIVLETNLDDETPEVLAYLIEELMIQGALDAFVTAVTMKKGRPGHLLTALCKERDVEKLKMLVMTESSTIGIRSHNVKRTSFSRKIKKIKTLYGEISVKITTLKGKTIGAKPEFEDVKKASKKFRKPLKTVMLEANKKALSLID